MSLEGGLDNNIDVKSPPSHHGEQAGLLPRNPLKKWRRTEREDLTKQKQPIVKLWRRLTRQGNHIETEIDSESGFTQALHDVAESQIGKLEEVDVKAEVMRLEAGYPIYREIMFPS